MVDLEYLKKSPIEKFGYNFVNFFKGFPRAFASRFKGIPAALLKLWRRFAAIFITIGEAARDGDWKTRVSFGVFGFGLFTRKQVFKGILYLLFEIAFILYMIFFGAGYLAKFGTLGEIAVIEDVWDEAQGAYVTMYYDNSLLILLYGLLTILFIIAFVYVWYYNVKVSKAAQDIIEARRSLPTAKDDLHDLADEQYHKTLLAMPMLGIVVFTVFPIIFMILVAFTNYDINHYPPAKLFTWVGWENFKNVLGGGVTSDSAKFAYTFGGLLLWTVIWALFATFSNYIFGMIVALMINKKGIKFKKLWRTILIMTIAVPQFVSLMLMSQMLGDRGVYNYLLKSWGLIDKSIPFLTNGTVAKVTIIIVNIWIGIPYTMLICTGILMNIPADLYESAKIDGASAFKMYMKITLPYMWHVTTPYLISQFIGNINNFNVIFLLTGGAPATLDYQYAGETDLLITWLYKLTFNEGAYGVASVISIFLFIIISVFSLILYNRSNAVKNEEEFM